MDRRLGEADPDPPGRAGRRGGDARRMSPPVSLISRAPLHSAAQPGVERWRDNVHPEMWADLTGHMRQEGRSLTLRWSPSVVLSLTWCCCTLLVLLTRMMIVMNHSIVAAVALS